MTTAIVERTQEAWELMLETGRDAWTGASAAMRPAAVALLHSSGWAAQEAIQQLRSADGASLATLSAAAGLAVLCVAHRRGAREHVVQDVQPSLFVYNSAMVAPDMVEAISKALKDAGCGACAMRGVANRAEYGAIFGQAMGALQEGSPSKPIGVLVGNPEEAVQDTRILEEARMAPVPSSTPSNFKGKDKKRESDIFAEFGTAVVGFFGGVATPSKDSEVAQELRDRRSNDVVAL